uniref:Conserved oligomeric Golgi complex subunit 3 n=1 Tax=Heterorhabditis bacteriophora TaxID=37862 RepID=A0A1I7WVF1_HETBA
MTWIRIGVMADLEMSVNDVRDRQEKLQVDYVKLGRGGADDDTFALLYGVFASRASSVKFSLLAYFQYDFGNEERLLSIIISPSLSIYSRTAALPISHPFEDFTEDICRLLYDMLRPIIFLFRASMYGQSDIAGYNPAAGDLAYPEKLEMMRNIERTQSSARQIEDDDSVDLKSYSGLNIFQISILINKLNGGRGKQIDAELFVVKHLLILREQTTPYRQAASHRADATLPMRDFSIDFARLKNSLFEDKSRWFELSSNNAFLELLFSLLKFEYLLVFMKYFLRISKLFCYFYVLVLILTVILNGIINVDGITLFIKFKLLIKDI